MDYSSRTEIINIILNKPEILSRFNKILKDEYIEDRYPNMDIVDRFEVEVVPFDKGVYKSSYNKKEHVINIKMFLNYEGDDIRTCDDLWNEFNVDPAWWEHDILPRIIIPLAGLYKGDTIIAMDVFSKNGKYVYCARDTEEHLTEGVKEDFPYDENSRKVGFNVHDITGFTDSMIESLSDEDVYYFNRALHQYTWSLQRDWDYYRDNRQGELRYIRSNSRGGEVMEILTQEQYDKVYNIKYKLSNETRKREKSAAEREGNKLLPIFLKFLEIDKNRNPKFYPEWLTLNVDEITNWGEIMVRPSIDVEKWLKQEGSLRDIRNTKNRIEQIWNLYVKTDRGLRLQQVFWLGMDDYIKKVFRKEIRPKFKELPGGDCIHSIIFRARNNWYDVDIQIYPRIKTECREWYYSRNFSEYRLQSEIKNILREYGWVEGKNYSFSSDRD